MTLLKPRKSYPKYQIHKPTNRAFVWWQKKRVYLGPANSPESHEAYNRFIAELAQSEGQPQVQASKPEPVEQYQTIAELMVAFLPVVKNLVCKNEFDNIRYSLRELRKLYGHTRVDQFGPKSLKMVRAAMIETGACRGTVNHWVVRLKRMFKWGVGEEIVPPSVYHGLQAVTGLRRGESKAKEGKGVKPVPLRDVEALLSFLSPTVATMVMLQYHTGMRPGETCKFKLCDVDMTNDVWLYQPDSHKNEWRGTERIVPIGPKAQAILAPYLDRAADEPLFSPAESAAWQRERYLDRIAGKRRTKAYPSEAVQKEKRKNRKDKRKAPLKRRPGKMYSTNTYRNAIEAGLERARNAGVEIPHWSPGQLRHSRATDVRRTHGIEAAQVVLGHAHADVTQIYAERDIQKAIEVARETG